MDDKNFHQLVTRLLTLMNIPHDRVPSEAAYTIGVDDQLQIDLIGLQEGFINLRAVLGPLPAEDDNDTLLRLLQANTFAFEHPPVSIGVDPATGTVVIWSRQALVELRDDSRCDWFERFIRIAFAVQAWLSAAPADRGAEGLPAGRVSHNGGRR